MNEKIKRFSFGEANIAQGNRRYSRTCRSELVLVSIADRKTSGKLKRFLVISLHPRIHTQVGWMKDDLIDLCLEGENLTDAILYPAPSGYLARASSSDKKNARLLIKIPVPEGYERFADLKAIQEGLSVECADGKIAFTMPF